jgi:signal transduction histidine kinase
MGSGIKNDLPFFARRSAVSRYVSGRIKDSTQEERKEFYGKLLKKLNMKVSFEKDDHRLPMPSKTEIEEILAKLGKFKPEDELDCGACGYSSCREHAIAIHKGMAETEMCLPYTIELLKKSLDDLKISNNQLESTRQALFNSEKLASMGQLSAGIAHEINNPLGVILLNANLLLESLRQGSDDYEDLKMIVDQAERCKKIVSGLLNFARKNKVVQQTTNIANLIRHCVKAIVVPDNIEIEISSDMKNPEAEADPDQIIQVLTNLIVNAFESMPGGGRVKVSSSDTKNEIIIKVIDTGSGISEDIRKKVFEPLFTTKQIGQGTGLGLAVSYGIIKMHKGKIDFTSNCNPANGPTGTEFTVTLPRYGKQ